MFKGYHPFLILIVWAISGGLGSALAGTASVVAHYEPAYDSLASISSWSVPKSDSGLVASVPADGRAHKVLLLLAFSPDQPIKDDLRGICFGLMEYDTTRLVIDDWGPWPPAQGKYLELPIPGWPGPSTGTALAYSRPEGSPSVVTAGRALVPIYWFQTIASAPCQLAFGPHKTQGGTFVTRQEPRTLSVISDFVSVGFGMAGRNPAPR